eukprot:c5168_g1_i1 orf=255-440(+)
MKFEYIQRENEEGLQKQQKIRGEIADMRGLDRKFRAIHRLRAKLKNKQKEKFRETIRLERR